MMIRRQAVCPENLGSIPGRAKNLYVFSKGRRRAWISYRASHWIHPEALSPGVNLVPGIAVYVAAQKMSPGRWATTKICCLNWHCKAALLLWNVKLVAVMGRSVWCDAVRIGTHDVHQSSLLPRSLWLNNNIQNFVPICTTSYPGVGRIKVLLNLELKNLGGTTPHATIQNNIFFLNLYIFKIKLN
jgi:hypothetical protein